ncbi:PRANC domain protein [Fusarium austroafricanum]|uniref:PRANC domain protein n=1 Tax=Fusarium austroafricanum TaxID=2364996 RepID=A0A8H4P8I8_9HYPO|nr:PRANC domain protein [Fusarium austroafricanum]
MARDRTSSDCLPPEIQNEIIGLVPILEPRGDLVLDISVHSPSDNQHWFEYLSFCSVTDTNLGECHEQRTTLTNDPAHGWVAGQQVLAPDEDAIELVFDEIMGEGPFDDEEPKVQWWRSLPFVPVVGVVLLRQQTRRRWKPVALANMLTRRKPINASACLIPGNLVDAAADQQETGIQTLIESFPSTVLCKLTIFENFNEAYAERYFESPAIRELNPAVSQKPARASLHLTMLSASFMADAGYFFAARQGSWKWDKLTSLALTSSVLADDADLWDINNMLRDAAAAALKMPRLDTIELWNGRRGVAMLFRYQRAQDRQSAIITVRETSELAPGIPVMQAWDAVAYRHRHGKVVVQTSLIDPDGIRCHGDAIRQLGLSTEVTRLVSLR